MGGLVIRNETVVMGSGHSYVVVLEIKENI